MDAACPSEEENAIVRWVRAIVEELLPLACVEKDSFRRLTSHLPKVSHKTIHQVLVFLAQHFEKEASQDMALAGGG